LVTFSSYVVNFLEVCKDRGKTYWRYGLPIGN